MQAADIQDRDGGELVMATMFGMFPFLLKLYAEGGYQGPRFRAALKKIIAPGRGTVSPVAVIRPEFKSCPGAGPGWEFG